jgi:prevent-host-death family protein
MAMGKVWTLQDAKNKFSAVVEAAVQGEPQHVTRRGVDAVVVLSAREYKELCELQQKAAPKRSFVEHLLAFPKLPEGMDDIFEDRHDYPSNYSEADLK